MLHLTAHNEQTFALCEELCILYCILVTFFSLVWILTNNGNNLLLVWLLEIDFFVFVEATHLPLFNVSHKYVSYKHTFTDLCKLRPNLFEQTHILGGVSLFKHSKDQ